MTRRKKGLRHILKNQGRSCGSCDRPSGPSAASESVIGGEIEVPSVYGERVTLKIKPGVKSGKRFRIAGKGINSSNGVGDMYVVLDIEPYLDINKKGRGLLLEFDKEVGKDVRKKLFKEAKL